MQNSTHVSNLSSVAGFFGPGNVIWGSLNGPAEILGDSLSDLTDAINRTVQNCDVCREMQCFEVFPILDELSAYGGIEGDIFLLPRLKKCGVVDCCYSSPAQP